MAQQYDTTGKDILNERINELAQFVLNVSHVAVIADLDTEQQLIRAFRTDITKRVRLNTHEAVLHIDLNAYRRNLCKNHLLNNADARNLLNKVLKMLPSKTL